MIVRSCDMCGKSMDPALVAYRLTVEDGRQPPVTYQVKHFDNAMCLALFAAGQCGKEVCDADK